MPQIPEILPEPEPFDMEGTFYEIAKLDPPEEIERKHTSLSGIFFPYVRPFFAQGYSGVAALNRGMAGFSAHLDSMAEFIEKSTGMKKGGLFEDAANEYIQNAEYWQKRADKWKRKQKFAIHSQEDWELISEAVSGVIGELT